MLFQLAIGDAYGAGFEYASKDFVAQHNNLERYISHPKHRQLPGTYTDDTQMALAIAELLIEKSPWTKEVIAQKFVDVFKRDPRKGYSQRFYWFLREVKDGSEFLARIDPRSTKSGAAMRAPPLGLLKSEAEVLAKAEFQARLTHDTPEGVASAQAAALTAHYFAYGLGPAEKLGRYLSNQVPYRYAWHKPWRGKVGPSGLEAVHAAVYVLSRESTLAGVLRETVNLTGDVDTVASIALAAASTTRDFLRDIPEALATALEHSTFGANHLQKVDRALSQLLPLRAQSSGEITRPFYREVIADKLRVVENIEHGQRIISECPFCDAEDFSIGAGFYKCFSCGKVGNAITFLVEVMKMPQDQAMDFYKKYM
ncbi:ADP-ribosyl-[dinitrogen reductase] glycohydrolase [Lacunisphaera limnophila]|uniref:ADP-ribosyl-[dinitrogen reductase] glycohydrolase n=1 Tax=Lacunisphaera limnophila TaxID=1838286 RepID=A0A1D8AZ09_9BACT|nr:ADP-ribosylglycohydrolase family protein [Lacunisphaera limnophila]AOS46119.1 ADP-ribosyl-[dinitrogen reductase] glycohydrolase [Lacunisphaera limnophila]